MSPRASDSTGARELGHLLAGRTEIGGVVAFGEGLQHLAEQPSGLVAPAPAPQAAQAESRAQLERPGLLPDPDHRRRRRRLSPADGESL